MVGSDRRNVPASLRLWGINAKGGEDLGGWVCSLGPPLSLIMMAWVGGHRAIVENNFTAQSVHGPEQWCVGHSQ